MKKGLNDAERRLVCRRIPYTSILKNLAITCSVVNLWVTCNLFLGYGYGEGWQNPTRTCTHHWYILVLFCILVVLYNNTFLFYNLSQIKLLIQVRSQGNE
jgi:hypothetical protein